MTGIVRQLDSAPGGRSLMRIVSPAQVQAAEKAQADEKEAANQSIIESSLASFVSKQWESSKSAKIKTGERMLKNLRQRMGEYSPSKLAEIKSQGGSEIFMMITNIKCRALVSWVNDILFQPGERPFECTPSPIPELPGFMLDEINAAVQQDAVAALQMTGMPITPEMMQAKADEIKELLKERIEKEAKAAAGRMTDKIEDQLEQGGFNDALKEFVEDLATFPAAIMRGPIIRKRKQMSWVRKGNDWKPEVVNDPVTSVYRVSPFDMYPGPNTTSINSGYLIERHKLRRKDLHAMIGVPGYSEEAIKNVLTDYGMGGLREWLYTDQERAQLESRHYEFLTSRDDTIDAIEYSGSVQGQQLRDWGMSEKMVPDVLAEYEANIWKIGQYIIRAVMNDDPLGRRTYHKACFENVPGSFWGIALGETIEDIQDVCNATARSLVNNLAISSGPQVEVYADRIAVGEDVTNIYPWKIWQMQSDPNGSSNNRAVTFYQPTCNANELMSVYNDFSKQADEHTGIPSYTYGSPAGGGAAGTASGLSMLMSAASRGIKMVVSHIDHAIEGMVTMVYDHNMLYDTDMSIKGDAYVVARASSSMMAKEQQTIRRNEFLNTTNNPTDMAIMGPDGRATVLRESAKSLDLPVDEVVPNKAKMAAKLAPPMQQPGAQNLDPAGNPAGGMNNFQQQASA